MEDTDLLLLELYENLGKDKEALSDKVTDICEGLKAKYGDQISKMTATPAPPTTKKKTTRKRR